MARYIDADNVIPKFKEWVDDVKKEYPDPYACAYIFTMNKIIEILESETVADVQPVIRCRDCKHCDSVGVQSIVGGYERLACIREGHEIFVDLDDYCSFAEREND